MRRCDARVFGRVWIKGIAAPINGTAIYTSSIQALCATFQNFLDARGEQGIVIADSRRPSQNARVSHSIFTQKYKVSGDPFHRIVEMPTFGHSENHAGIQIADLLCSALLFPMAVHSYCSGHVTNIHVRPGYEILKRRFGSVLKALQHRYQDENLRWRGGVTVSDELQRRSGGLLF